MAERAGESCWSSAASLSGARVARSGSGIGILRICGDECGTDVR